MIDSKGDLDKESEAPTQAVLLVAKKCDSVNAHLKKWPSCSKFLLRSTFQSLKKKMWFFYLLIFLSCLVTALRANG